MAREEFIDNLRLASRDLLPPTVESDQGPRFDSHLRSALHSADFWLTGKSVEGFDPADFEDWPRAEREELAREVAAFKAIAEKVPANKPAPKLLSKQAREHLERVIEIVRRRLLPEWLDAQETMLREATEAAKANRWYVERDEKEIVESLLGPYKAPRLRIRTQNREVVLDPIARFGSGRRGVVDLVVMPTYETTYLVAFSDGHWQIIPTRGGLHIRPFNRETLTRTIDRLPTN